jgi:6-phosphogluconolactonase/glucosamine-6-phosphate isomerase/deaminase
MFEDNRLTERVATEIPTTVFNVTGGRLGGELYEGLLRLIMETVELDKKSFTLDSERSLTPEESANLDDVISKMRLLKEESLDEFLSSF